MFSPNQTYLQISLDGQCYTANDLVTGTVLYRPVAVDDKGNLPFSEARA